MDIAKVKEYINGKTQITVPELQTALNIGYGEAIGFIKTLEEENCIKYDSGLTYRVLVSLKPQADGGSPKAYRTVRSILEERRRNLMKNSLFGDGTAPPNFPDEDEDEDDDDDDDDDDDEEDEDIEDNAEDDGIDDTLSILNKIFNNNKSGEDSDDSQSEDYSVDPDDEDEEDEEEDDDDDLTVDFDLAGDEDDDDEDEEPVYSHPLHEKYRLHALKAVVDSGHASVSFIQRTFPVGYIGACKIIDWMEKEGYISELQGSLPRKVYLTREQFYNLYGDQVFDERDRQALLKIREILKGMFGRVHVKPQGNRCKFIVTDDDSDPVNWISAGLKNGEVYYTDGGRAIGNADREQVNSILAGYGLVEENGEIRAYHVSPEQSVKYFMTMYAALERIRNL